MNSTVYIESIDKYPSDDWSYSAFIGYRNKGADIKLFSDIKEVPLKRNIVLVACIESTHYWFEQMGWTIPDSITIPEELNKFLFTFRNIDITDIRTVLGKSEYPFFIKSYELKKFSPMIIKDEVDIPFISSLLPDMKVVVSELVDFVSEWRVYVLEGKIIGVCNYAGEYLVFPSSNAINNMIKSFKNAPVAYSLDVGIIEKMGSLNTILVECNDFYSLGNYGLFPQLYTRALSARWRQILEQNPVKL